MNQRAMACRLIAVCGLAMSGTAGFAQDAAAPSQLNNGGVAPFLGKYAVNPDNKMLEGDLLGLARQQGATVFDGVVMAAEVAPIPGTRLLGTTYVFQVNEWFRGQRAVALVSFREVGGEGADGSGMSTCQSHKLAIGGRYLVFARPGAEGINMPFDRVLQVLDSGRSLADEGGRMIVDVTGGWLTTRRAVGVTPARYNASTHDVPSVGVAGAPTAAMGFDVAQPAAGRDPETMGYVSSAALFDQLRPMGQAAPAGAGPAGLPGPDHQLGLDFSGCGYPPGLRNYAYWLPSLTQLPWFDDSMFYWNQQVAAGGSSGYMYGRFVGGGGQPTTNTAPVGNNGTNNAGTPADAQMTAGGYGTWAANGSPNGICFQWYDSGCGNIRETDVFVNPVNNGNELQFRKSCVHELGHAYGANHEDRYVAIMVSGTWRVVPGYGTNAYIRADEVLGARAAMAARNSISGFVFNLASYRDIATSAQSHPNWGTSGDIGTNVSTFSPTFVSTNDLVTLSRMYVENRGPLAYNGAVALNVYLSSDTNITSGDFLVYSGGWGSFAGSSVANNFSIGFNVPPAVPSGTYYVGWIVSSGEAELDGSNNRALVTTNSSGGFSPRTITVNNIVPVNDACGNATLITAGSYFGSNAGATSDGATFCGSNTGKDVWFNWVAPCSGSLTVSTCGSNYDTVLSVYQNGCASTVAYGCNDDDTFCGGSPARQSRIAGLAVTGGSTYLIRVAGYNQLAGNYQLNVDFNPNIPSNNLCPSAIGLSGTGAILGSTACAAPGTQANSCGNSLNSPEVWYEWTPQCSGIATVGTCLSTGSYDTVIGAWNGCPGLGGTELACDDDGCGYPLSQISFPVVAGNPYWIRVSGYNANSGTFRLDYSVATSVLSNDDCSAPLAIGNGLTSVSTCGATSDGAVYSNCSPGLDRPLGNNVWYAYTALGTGPVSVSMCDANYDSLLAVFVNGCPGAGVGIGCNDDACGTNGLGSSVSFNAVLGNTYLISVGGFSTSTGNATLVINGPTACYANCDGSVVAPVLGASDFSCFLAKYRAGDAYANCDGSTTLPVLGASDFSCFLARYRAGC